MAGGQAGAENGKLTCMIGGLALGGISGVSYVKSKSAFKALQSSDTSNTVNNTLTQFENARKKRNSDLAGTVAGAMAAFIGSVGFFWTFSF